MQPTQNSDRDSDLSHDRGSHWGMLLPARLSHHCEGQFDNPTPDAGRKDLPEEGNILVGEAPLAVILEVPPHFIETFTICIIETFCFFGDRQKPARQDRW